MDAMTTPIEDVAVLLTRMPVGGELRFPLREFDAVRYDESRYDELEHHLRALLEGSAYGAYRFERRSDIGEMIVHREPPGACVYDRQGHRLPSRLNRVQAPLYGEAGVRRKSGHDRPHDLGMEEKIASPARDALAFKADALGVRLVARREQISSSLLSEAEIDAAIGRLHAELDGVSAEMKTALRKVLETPLLGEDDA